MDEYDGDGNLVSVIGKQYDGTHGAVVVSGPVPPVPNAPLVTGGLSLNIGWDGTFVNDAGVQDITIPAPMDFTRVELHASRTSGFSADTADTLIDTIESPRGGTRPAMLDEGTWYAVLVARSASGKRSAQSAEASAVVTPPVGADVDVDALREEFAAADEALNKALAENAVVQLALRGAVTELQDTTLPALNAELSQAKGRLDDADHLLNVTFPQRISEAEGTAGTALANANSALTMAGSGSRVLYGTTNPSGTAREGDTWRKTASATGDVIAEWRYTKNGAGTLAWTPQKVTSDMVSNLDIGKLSAGTGTFITAVAEKMATATASIQKADIGNLTVTGNSALNTLTAQRIASGVGQFIDLSTDQLTAGTASIGTAVADRLFADIFSTRKLNASQVFIGHPGNMYPDPMFMQPGFITRQNDASTCRVYKSGANLGLDPGTTTTTYYRPMGEPQNTTDYKNWISVQPGEAWELSFDTDAWKVASVAKFVGRTLDGQAYANPTKTVTVPVGSTSVKLVATIPADCYWICPEISVLGGKGISFIKAGSIMVRQIITPSLIVDGFFQGLRVIGASIETNTAASRGVKMTDAGLFAYDSTGKETLRFDGANSILTGATIRTAASGARIQISETGLHGWGADNVQYLKADSSGLEMTGSITSTGKTTEAVPRTINASLQAVVRDITGQESVANPSLIFDTGEYDPWNAPGINSPDGRSLQLQAGTVVAFAHKVTLGSFPTPFAIDGNLITIGNIGFLGGPPAAVNLLGNVKVNGGQVMKTVTPNIPADQQPIELIANGSATTNAQGEFTITFPTGAFPTACVAIFMVPNSGGAVIPVVNGTTALSKTNCRAVQPGNGNKAITYSYRAIGY
ncbi:hypothetical protein KKR91_01105 [Arthrobacter jiangjiafuii]|uniref:Putative tail fiber protein gp53-like C-terminal domain-containing protein n=1 Tax=Arthrobacter jiangjiafuii TaxID=2817475 RepID=A0A975M5H5_9MICC|nr:hypothetical protein [Arthrobacter jiangjiafuii]MBP3044895.1 hypothetical protein [Arthrobacter jiangjiafuii]QWC10282.1 hypothetical protein KKR91_01105 [Arthrobacter jiangjiafuii]